LAGIIFDPANPEKKLFFVLSTGKPDDTLSFTLKDSTEYGYLVNC
jgi:hypothetical protein